MKYGQLEILSYSKKGTYRTAICKCDCGNTKEVLVSNLRAGRTKSCGCLERKNQHTYVDISEKKFGCLKVLEPTKKRDKDGNITWKCRCDCGTILYCVGRYLTRGYTKDCGCRKRKKFDITGKKIGYLTALKPENKTINSMTNWICKCNCETLCKVSYKNLTTGHTRSCGCLRRNEYRTTIDGTVVECLMSKLYVNNTSGVKGVAKIQNKWVAYITFAQKTYSLGRFESLEEAREARIKAEGEMFEPIIRKMNCKENDQRKN